MIRTPLIAGNWKMYKTGDQAVETAGKLADLSAGVTGVDIMIAPNNLALPLVSKVLENSQVKVGGQNLYTQKEGAFTGEVSGDMLRAAGADYVLIGHSERRQFFGDTDELVCQKTRAALGADLIPIVCIGETENERDEEKTFFVLDKQVSDGLKGFGLEELNRLVLAYEPVWAIGTGKTASVKQVEEVHRFLRKLLKDKFSDKLAKETRILYGGSVKPDNVKDLMSIEDVDGALVGGASLEADKFINIIRYE
jgi:triosephosphate isomerase